MTLAPGRLEEIVPHTAGWCSGETPYGEYLAPPFRLTPTARRLDISPAWFSWVGTAPVLELIETVGVPAIQAHDVALANAFRVGLGLAPSDSAIVVSQPASDLARLRAAGVMASEVGGAVRTSWHVYNSQEDVEAALAALGR